MSAIAMGRMPRFKLQPVDEGVVRDRPWEFVEAFEIARPANEVWSEYWPRTALCPLPIAARPEMDLAAPIRVRHYANDVRNVRCARDRGDYFRWEKDANSRPMQTTGGQPPVTRPTSPFHPYQ